MSNKKLETPSVQEISETDENSSSSSTSNLSSLVETMDFSEEIECAIQFEVQIKRPRGFVNADLLGKGALIFGKDVILWASYTNIAVIWKYNQVKSFSYTKGTLKLLITNHHNTNFCGWFIFKKCPEFQILKVIKKLFEHEILQDSDSENGSKDGSVDGSKPQASSS